MTTIRRSYMYLLAFAGLSLLTVATANLGQVLIDLMSGKAADLGSVRDDLARDAAAVVVGLPVWLLHWLWAERSARADERERASTLRRLYLYVVLASAMLVMAYSVRDAIIERAARDLPYTLVALVVWLGHWRIAARDRDLVGEVGGSATLRRWYIYGLAYVGFLTLLSGASSLLEWAWRTLTGLSGAAVDEPLASTVVGLGLWLVHWFVLPERLAEAARRDDGGSVLRSV
jgi:hypothetical protein